MLSKSSGYLGVKKLTKRVLLCKYFSLMSTISSLKLNVALYLVPCLIHRYRSANILI